MTWVGIGGALLFFVGILVSIALHEMGHLVPAKLFGVRVTQYMVGFGRTLWSRRRGDTEYGVKLFPVGGYVRMIGMFPPAADGRLRRASTGPFQSLVEDARRQTAEELRPGDERRVFYAKPWWQKLIVMSGGPLVNVILAFGMFAVVLIGFGVYRPTTTVAHVSDCVVPASANRTTCTPADPVAPAKAAGLRPGDQIVSFAGTPVRSWAQVQREVRAAAGTAVQLGVVRDGHRLTLTATPARSRQPSLSNPNKLVDVGFLGVSPTEAKHHEGPLAVVSTMGSLSGQAGIAIVHLPQRMVGVVHAAFGGTRAENSPMSVVGASRVAGQIAEGDVYGVHLSVADRIATFIQWLGALNLFLALFNFVPLLPLDGGHIAGALYEAVRRAVARFRRRPDPGFVDVAKAMPLAYLAASVILVMGVLLIYADIVNPVRISS